LRKSIGEDIIKQMEVNEKKVWSSMFGLLNCMHLDWKNCPTTWHGQFIDKDGNYSITLEVVCNQSLWIWCAFFGMTRTNNDINALDRSLVMHDYLHNQIHGLNF